MWTRVGLRNHVLWGLDLPMGRGNFEGGNGRPVTKYMDYRHVRLRCGLLSNYFDHLLLLLLLPTGYSRWSTAGIDFTQRSIIRFFATQGETLHLSIHFILTGAGWSMEPQQLLNFMKFVKIIPQMSVSFERFLRNF